MKKKVLSFVIALMVALMPCTSVFAAQYQPTEKIYAENYMLVSLDDKNYPVVCSKNEKGNFGSPEFKIVREVKNKNKRRKSI